MSRHFVFAAALILAGCYATAETIHIPYKGRANLTVVPNVAQSNFEAFPLDRRTIYRDRVSIKKSAMGDEHAFISAKNDVARTFTNAVAFELENLGFKQGPGGKRVTVELMRFYADYKTEPWFGTADVVGDGGYCEQGCL